MVMHKYSQIKSKLTIKEVKYWNFLIERHDKIFNSEGP